jgi:UTP--glucose-1-phosphate uridylyltransferase
MNEYPPGFSPFLKRMRREGLPDLFIRTFAHYYEQLAKGETGLIPESDIRLAENIPDLDHLDEAYDDEGERALSKTVVVKLNGGLGTSMGLDKAKSLLQVREGLSFLDVIARQALHAGIPLVLMNSFRTDSDSLEAFRAYPELIHRDFPLSFLQHKEPKISQDDLGPVSWPKDPTLEWCPPGHGDLYTALVTSGTLDKLLKEGLQFAFVSNSDNLGADLDKKILGYLAKNEVPFLMEVAERTEMDRKGGHLAKRPDGQLILRESAQCPPDDMGAFQDIERHRFFNTNSLWFNLKDLKKVMDECAGNLGLPMIRNSKTVDPTDKTSPAVYQLETAMGSAIGVFKGAEALRVPRERFAPVKTTNELLAVRSDAYLLTEEFRIVPNPERRLGPLVIKLDSRHYKMVSDFGRRFPHGSPSLVGCSSFDVDGDFVFGKDVKVIGHVRLVNESSEQVAIADGTVVEGENVFR